MSAVGTRKPISRQRSPWEDLPTQMAPVLGLTRAARRRVGDGTLRALLAEEPTGWHLSISFVDHKGEPSRYPRWDEIADARDQFLPAELAFVMHLPASDEYVAMHPTTFHLHEHPPRERAT